MKFKIDRNDFLETLQRVQGVVGKKNTMPILSNLLLEAVPDRINILATDLEVFIKDSTPATVEEEGSITVNARKLFEIVKELPEGAVDISLNGEDKVKIKGGKAKFNVLRLPAKDFPIFPSIDGIKLEEIESGTLGDMVDKTSFAVSMDETRYNINGFFFERCDSKIRLVATDGHRLAIVEKDGGGIPVPKEGVVLPYRGMMELRKLLKEDGDGISLAVTEKSALVKKGDTFINMRLFEGEFPDYKKVIPKDNDKALLADRTTLLSSLKRVSILLGGSIKAVKLELKKDRLVLSSSSPEFGDAREEVDVEYSGSDMEIGFNASYLIDVLEAMDDEKVKVELKDQLLPAVVKLQGSGDYQCIIMPMRL